MKDTTFGELTRATIVEAAAVLGINSETANRLLNSQLSRIGAHADELLSAIAGENTRLVAERGELAATFAGEMRCLRAIAKVVIQDMVAKIRQ